MTKAVITPSPAAIAAAMMRGRYPSSFWCGTGSMMSPDTGVGYAVGAAVGAAVGVEVSQTE